MKPKYEVIEIDNAQVTVDISLLSKTEELFFNATDMAKHFGKKPDDFLRLSSTAEYIDAILKSGIPDIKTVDDLIRITKGKYGGTWLHKELAFEFAGWCSAIFRRNLHKWAEARLEQERIWRQKRLETKTGFKPLTDAIQKAHDPVMPYHFSNECEMINKIVLGMRAKPFCEQNQVTQVRDALDARQLQEINQLQLINAGLIQIGMDYETRKMHLQTWYERQLLL
ncbi:KilA-N domain-containing protein [Methylomonas rapida]|uniref:KilA-N domain-containing protein n=1 Tax=Methylomonas rapida TaxID=2963939 RepID=A0ABY7GR07_9GAMM|nr:KilA-N domain-containing protein [Methylomonas rapida]WAR46944.1 KilA-N domain-containing protein [Methylomonas rapida]